MNEETKSKVVIITGAGRRLGRAFAIGLSRAGYTVVATGRDETELEEVASRLTAPFLTLRCDITNPSDCEATVRASMEKFGRIDVLVNNAGIYTQKSFLDASSDEVRSVFDVVVTGSTTMSTAVLKAMKPAGAGQLVTISDVAVRQTPTSVPKDASGVIDVAAKVAKLEAARAIALEASLYGVTSTMFYMDWVASEIDIDDPQSAPKGATHPADAAASLREAIDGQLPEVVLPASELR